MSRMKSMNIKPRTRLGYTTYIPMYGRISSQPPTCMAHDMYVRYQTYRRVMCTSCAHKLLKCIAMYACHACSYTCMHVCMLPSFCGYGSVTGSAKPRQGSCRPIRHPNPKGGGRTRPSARPRPGSRKGRRRLSPSQTRSQPPRKQPAPEGAPALP